MDWSNFPSLNSLRAFSALAETGGYSKAAARLNVTHAAVRQQVKSLETHLGVSLAVREGRGVALTAEGVALARDVDAGFSVLRKGVEALTRADASHPVQITTSPAFAVEWLMPRIPEFQQRYPAITLMLNPTAEVIDLKPGGIDLATRYCDRPRLDSVVTPVLVSDMVVIGTPELIGERIFDDPASFMNLPWLQEFRTDEVTQWLARRGVIPDRRMTISHMPGNLIMQAVRRGDGVTYTARAFVQEDIREGRVRVLYSEAAFGIYYIVSNPGPMRPAVRTFMNWLKTKAETVTA